MASAGILKAVKLLRNYCQITVRLPLDYSAIIWHSQELRSGKVRRWASLPSNIHLLRSAVTERGGIADLHAGRMSQSIACHTKTSRGRALAARFLPERPCTARTGGQLGSGLCRSDKRQDEGGLLPHRASRPLALYRRSTKRAVRAQCAGSSAEPNAIGSADGPARHSGGGASYGGPADPALSTPGKTAVIAHGERQARERMKNIG
jgi:hypothetical protein